ncbi:MAG: DUF2339 domain-containing protein, partial [Gemmatimonadaceae bacterium]|nr:DUF2339 domain-containing protein [Gemmatimonadaceae bacterium]
MTETERIERLESIVRALYQQVAELRAEVGALRSGAPAPGSSHPADVERVERHVEPTSAIPVPSEPESAPPPPEPSAGPAGSEPYRPPPFVPRPKPEAVDLEALIGRYGTIALAALAILMGAGAFLTWAIAHGLLGPVQRVILGAIGAAMLGGVGAWLRGRGTVRFGNTVLALALALVHLDAWAAGPRLHVVSPTLALAAAALASVALATLALSASDESLFSVGLGGALLAPFVTSTGGGTAPMLATYGWIVIAGGIAALRERQWRVALFILGAACAVYAAAAADLASAMSPSPWLDRHTATLFALACAAAALLWGAHAVRARLALAFLLVAMLAQLPADTSTDHLRSAIPLALAGTLLAYAALRAGVPAGEVPWRLAGAMFAPLGFLAGAVGALVRPDTPTGAAIAAGWTLLALAMAWADDERRGLHLAAAAFASGAGVF